MAGICAPREQNQQGVQEQVLNVKILSPAEEAPEPHIAGAWASIYAKLHFGEAKLHIAWFLRYFLEICCKLVKEADHNAGQSFSLVQATHSHVSHGDAVL